MSGLDSLDVVYVNFGSARSLAASAESLRGAAGQLGVELNIVVVDHGTPEADVDLGLDDVRDRFDHLVRAGGNAGFAVGANRGAGAGSQSWILFLNPDTLVDAEGLEPLLSIAVSRGAGLFGPLKAPSFDSRFVFSPLSPTTLTQGLRNALFERGWGAAAASKELSRRVRLVRSQRAHAVEAISGAAMLVDRPSWSRLGGFDERYFLYVEDSDLCRRMRREGGEVLLVSSARIVHRGEESARLVPGRARAAREAGESLFQSKFGTWGRRRGVAVANRAVRGLPPRSNPWEDAAPVDVRDFARRAPQGGTVFELARSPRFDNGLIAVADGGLDEADLALVDQFAGESGFARWSSVDGAGRGAVLETAFHEGRTVPQEDSA